MKFGVFLANMFMCLLNIGMWAYSTIPFRWVNLACAIICFTVMIWVLTWD